MLNDYKLFEKKSIMLLEERGVAAIPYKHVVDTILNVCRRMATRVEPQSGLAFDIPEQITKRIDIVDDLKISVTLYNLTGDYEFNGSGDVQLIKLGKHTPTGNLSEVKLKITGYCYTDDELNLTTLYDRTILCSLYHELNHLVDVVEDWRKTETLHRTKRSVNIADNEDDVITGDKYIDDYFIDLIYRLYSESEFNALTASVYGDLSGIKSIRKNVSEDIKKTKAYKKYDYFIRYFSDYMKRLVQLDNGESLRAYLNSKNIVITSGRSNCSFLDAFRKRTRFMIKKLFKKIIFVADKYYMDEEFEYPKNIKMILK